MTDRGSWITGLVLWGVVVLLALWLVPERVERDVLARARAAIDSGGHAWAQVTVDGRDAILSGAAPAPGAAERAVSALRKVRGVRTVRDGSTLAEVAAGVPAARPAPASPLLAAYTAAERAGLPHRLAPALCQRLFDALLARSKVHFETATAVIRADSEPLLRHLVTVAVHCPDSRLEVAAHTDRGGDNGLNLALSEARARAVRDYLVARGVRAERLRAVGYGAAIPLASDDSERGRARNRRIEIRVQY